MVFYWCSQQAKKERTTDMIRRKFLSLILTFALMLTAVSCFTFSANAAYSYSGSVIYLSDNGDDTKDGKTVENAVKTLPKALELVNNGLINCNDEAALKQYLADLKLSRITGNYTLEEFDRELALFYRGTEFDFCIQIRDQILEIIEFGQNHNPLVFYQVRNEIDWEYLSSLFSPRFVQDPGLGFPPEMRIMTDSASTYYTNGIMRTLTVNGELQEDDVYFAGYSLVGVDDLNIDTVHFAFSHKPSLPFRIEITDHTGKQIDSIAYTQLSEPYLLPVYDDASYRCFVTFEDETSVVDMEYSFNMHYFRG